MNQSIEAQSTAPGCCNLQFRNFIIYVTDFCIKILLIEEQSCTEQVHSRASIVVINVSRCTASVALVGFQAIYSTIA